MKSRKLQSEDCVNLQIEDLSDISTGDQHDELSKVLIESLSGVNDESSDDLREDSSILSSDDQCNDLTESRIVDPKKEKIHPFRDFGESAQINFIFVPRYL